MATGGVASVVFVVVGVGVDGMVLWEEREESGVMVDVDVTVMFNIHHVMC